MKKLIVIFLGFLVGSIIPIKNYAQEEILALAVALTVGSIIFETFRKKITQYLSVFFSSIVAGILITLLFFEWNELAQTITLCVFAVSAVIITLIVGAKESNVKGIAQKRKENQESEEDKQW